MTRKRGLALALVVIAGLLVALWLGRQLADPTGDDADTSEDEHAGPTRAHEPDDDRDLLPDRARLAGQVIDIADAPIAKAQVCLSADNPTLMANLDWRPRCVSADERGRFSITNVAPGRHRLLAAARGFIPPPVARGRQGLAITVAAGEVREGLILRLRPGGAEVRGVVSDITGGTVSGALVFASTATTSTDDEGRFSLWLDVRSFVQLDVIAEGYARAGVVEWRPIGRELDIQLRPEVVLIGRVIDADTSEPVPGVPVVVGAPAMLGYSGSLATQPQVLTDDDGRFRFPGLRPGRYKPEVRHGHHRGMARESVLLVLGGEPSEVVIRVHTARQLAGRVVREGSGDACEAGMVTIHDAAGAVVDRGIADAGGAVDVGGLLPGTYTLAIQCDEAESTSASDMVDLSEQDLVDGLWEVEAPSGRAIRGRVLDSAGRGVALAYVQGELYEPADAGSKAVARAVTAADGSFEMLDLPPGLYSFYRVQAEGMPEPSEYPKVTLARDRDTEDVEIVLPEPGALRVRVRDPGGEPVPDASIRVVREGGLGGTIWKSTPDSEWLLDPITPGGYRVKVNRAGVGGRAGPEDPEHTELGELVEVVAGATAELTLVVPARKATISGIVRTRDGDLVADASVWALASDTYIDWGGNEKRPEVARTVTDVDGSFTLAQLEAGSFSVHARSLAEVEQSLDGVASGATGVVLELPEEGSLAGRVIVEDGDPPSRFTISITPVGARRGRSEEFLFTEGEWRVVGLPPGEVVVEVEAAEGSASAAVTIPEGGERDGIELKLAARGTLRGRVVDAETGDPIAGFRATVVSSNGRASAADLDLDGRHYTDAEGSFELRGVPSGSVNLHLWPFRGASRGYRHVNMTIEVAPGESADAGTISAQSQQANDETGEDQQ